MTKAVPALLALLLVCSLPAAAVVAAAPSQPTDRDASKWPTIPEESNDAIPGSDASLANVPATAPMLDGASENTTNRLGLDGTQSQSHVRPGSDFGAAAAMADDELHADFDLYRTEHEWDRRPLQERRASLERGFERIDERIDELDERERAAVAAHADGEASAADLVRTFVRTDQESRTLADHLRTLDSLADEVPGYSVDVSAEQAILETHQSSLRASLATTFDGVPTTRESNAVLVQATDSGAVLSVIEHDLYLRDASRFDNRDLDAPDSMDSNTSTVGDRRAELYPWATGDGDAGSSGIQIRADRQLYPINVKTTQGHLWASIDGGTGDVFSERQEFGLADLPTTPMDRTWVNESLGLSVNRTPVGGPIEVTATDRDAGEPVDAAVTIDGTPLGETGEDGSLWVLPPAGGYDLGIQTDDRTVNATITPG